MLTAVFKNDQKRYVRKLRMKVDLKPELNLDVVIIEWSSINTIFFLHLPRWQVQH